MSAAIEIENWVFIHERGRKVEALRGLNLQVAKARLRFSRTPWRGKTTTMHVLLGFIEFQAGTARVYGEDVRRAIARRRIGYLPERAESYPFLTGRELLRMAGNLFGLRGAPLKTRIGECSRG
jgi:ABC-2 type transport system ATP-binding protein